VGGLGKGKREKPRGRAVKKIKARGGKGGKLRPLSLRKESNA